MLFERNHHQVRFDKNTYINQKETENVYAKINFKNIAQAVKRGKTGIHLSNK